MFSFYNKNYIILHLNLICFNSKRPRIFRATIRIKDNGKARKMLGNVPQDIPVNKSPHVVLVILGIKGVYQKHSYLVEKICSINQSTVLSRIVVIFFACMYSAYE